jgi:Flp pilus assembly protein TadG
MNIMLLLATRGQARAGRGLAADKSAAVAIIFATMIVPICMLTALVIDYGFVMQTKSQLDLAADAAALAAARTAGSGYAAGQQATASGNTPGYLTEGNLAGNQWFAAQAGNVPHALSYNATATVSQTGQTFTATVTYTAQVSETMPGIFKWKNPNTGLADANISGTSTAVIIVNAFGTVDFLLDNTSSMMLPATDADLLTLQTAEKAWLTNASYVSNQNYVEENPGPGGLVGGQLTSPYSGITISGGSNAANANNKTLTAMPVGQFCAFACHWVSTSTATNPQDYYGVARTTPEKLRFDEVQTATQIAIGEMETLEQTLGQLAVGVFSFGGPAMTSSSYLTTIYGETPLDTTTSTSKGVIVKSAGGQAAIAALATITPPVTGDVANTNIGNAITYMLAKTGVAGNGNTAATPRRSLLLVTDGVEDDTEPQSIPSTEGPINPAVCNAIKAAGYTVYILYTPYSPEPIYLPNNTNLIPYINATTSPGIYPALQNCASSPSNVIKASSESDIQAGMVQLIDEAVGNTTRLSN